MKKFLSIVLSAFLMITCVSCSANVEEGALSSSSESSVSSENSSTVNASSSESSKTTSKTQESSKRSESSAAISSANSSKVEQSESFLEESKNSSSVQSSDNTFSGQSSVDTSSNQSSTAISGSQSSQESSSEQSPTPSVPTSDGFMTTSVLNGYVKENNVYTISVAGDYILSGTLEEGQIIVNVGEEDKVSLILNGVNMTNSTDSIIKALCADRLSVKVVHGTTNVLTDKRSVKTVENEEIGEGVINAKCDLTLTDYGDSSSQAILNVTGSYNNGVHTSKDLTLKKLDLTVKAPNNAIKGNNSITVSSGNITAISTCGDGLKSKDSGLTSKGKQKGNITISGGVVKIYASCDGIDASYNAEITGGDVKIYTNEYSEYTEGVMTSSTTEMYIRVSSSYYNSSYRYAVYFYNGESDYVWADATYFTSSSSSRPGGSTYYYYKLNKPSSYGYFAVYRFTSTQTSNSTTDYNAKSGGGSVNGSMDTFSISRISSSTISGDWTTYSSSSSSQGGFGGMGGMGGMDEGNTDKLTYSAKGIKAKNEINISGGTIYVNSYDDALHANNDDLLDTSAYGSGNINITGGSLTLLSNDDGIHADGILTVSSGTIRVERSYEGLEGNQIICNGADVYIVSSDDGMNATDTALEGAITISAGNIFVNAGGDGIDSNSRASYKGIIISGGNSIIISNGPSDSSIDTESGYTYTGGTVLGIGRSGGMSSEAKNCSNFSSVGVSSNLNAQQNSYVVVKVGSTVMTAVKMPTSINSLTIYLGSSSATVSTESSVSVAVNSDGYYFNV